MGTLHNSMFWAHRSVRLLRRSVADLVPIVEPQVDIHDPDRAQAEALLKAACSKASTNCRESTVNAQDHTAGAG